MKEFHKVTTRITDTKSTITYSGVVEAEELPQTTSFESARVDIYEDFFNTEEEARMFIRTQDNTCNYGKNTLSED